MRNQTRIVLLIQIHTREMEYKIIKIEEIADRQVGDCIRISANLKPVGFKRFLPYSLVANSYDCDTYKFLVPCNSKFVAMAKNAQSNKEYLDIDLAKFRENESERWDDIFVDTVNLYFSDEFFGTSKTNNPNNIIMNKDDFNLEEYIDSYFDYAMSRAVQLEIVNETKEWKLPDLKDSVESFWNPIGSFVHKQFQTKYVEQQHLEPIVAGQITAYAGMATAYLWNHNRAELTNNLLEGEGEYELNESGKAIYNFLGVKFVSNFVYDLDDVVKEADDIDNVQKYLLKNLGYIYETEEEINLRGAFNKIFSEFYLKIHEETKKRNITSPITITVRTMNLMFKIGLAIGMQKYSRRFHIVGWIDGESKNPPRFLVAANQVNENNRKVNYDIDKRTTCFLLPYSLKWFDVIDKHQCDKEEGIVVEWEPDMGDYEPEEVTISGEKHEGYMHKELIIQRNALRKAR